MKGHGSTARIRHGAFWAILAGMFAHPASGDDCGAPVFSQQNQFGARMTLSFAWGDANRDGRLDLAAGNTSGQGNELYLNAGGGGFTQSNQFGTGNAFCVVWVDPDNDGDLDLAVGQGGQNRLYLNNGAAVFTLQNQFGALSTAALAWADYDRDGDLDGAVGNGIVQAPQQNALYVNNANGTFTGQSQFGLLRTNTMAWCDFDGDGDPDLAVGNGGFVTSEQNALYVNNGNGTFTQRAEFGVADTPAMAWGDMDNDGDFDLCAANWKSGTSYLYVNNGDGTFTPRPAFGARDTNTLALGDFDLDGDLDAVVGNGDFTTADQNYLYVNDGTGNFAEIALFDLGSTDAMAWGDYDNDGDLDLAVGNEHTPTQNYLFTNGCTAGRYLRVRTIGQFHARGAGFSNRDGVGATLRVYAAGHLYDPAFFRALRQVEAKGGFSCQQQPEPHFGLPQDESVDLSIRWSGSGGSAISQELFGVAADQYLTVNETADGNMDCDGVVGSLDVARFVAALLDPEGYPDLFAGCNIGSADTNNDGRIDGDDIVGFLNALL